MPYNHTVFLQSKVVPSTTKGWSLVLLGLCALRPHRLGSLLAWGLTSHGVGLSYLLSVPYNHAGNISCVPYSKTHTIIACLIMEYAVSYFGEVISNYESTHVKVFG